MKNSIYTRKKTRSFFEQIMRFIFLGCGLVTVIFVVLISLYMILSGAPFIAKIGASKFLLGRTWNPNNNQFGILPLILSSITATFIAISLAIPIGLSVAVFLSFLANKKIASFLRGIIELLAGIPSVVYGLLGAILIVPLVFRIQTYFKLPTSGSLLAAAIVLVIMILPTIISVSEASLRAVPKEYLDASLALGASKMQSIWKVIIPSAKNGIATSIVLGIGRAIGETMAVMMVAGNAPIMPEFLKPARLLTVGISLEWAYSSGLHREALLGIGLVLFCFIMFINLILNWFLKKGGTLNQNAK